MKIPGITERKQRCWTDRAILNLRESGNAIEWTTQRNVINLGILPKTDWSPFPLQDKLEEEMRKTNLNYFHKALLEVVMCEESQPLLPIPYLLTITFTSKFQPQSGISITTWLEELCSCYLSAWYLLVASNDILIKRWMPFYLSYPTKDLFGFYQSFSPPSLAVSRLISKLETIGHSCFNQSKGRQSHFQNFFWNVR